MKQIILNNGVEMPQVGLGTFLIPKEYFSDTILNAYDLGYRQFDTAWRYQNESDLSLALQKNKIKREDVFITTKVNAHELYLWGYWFGKRRFLNVRNFKSIKSAIEDSFENLGTDYIDLFLVHWPWPIFRDMYKELVSLYKEKRIRAIGVSNCLKPHIDYLLEATDVIPAVNQIEISPLNTQKDTINYCQSLGISVEAMSTFSHFRSTKPREEILQNKILLEIAREKDKSVVQVVLRWLIQQNIIVIPKTWDINKLKENINIFDFSLEDDEMSKIDSLDKGRFLNYDPFSSFESLPRRIYKDWKPYKDWKYNK